MRENYPIIIIGAVLGVLSILFIMAYMSIRKQKEAIGFDRNMKDGEITKEFERSADLSDAEIIQYMI